MKRTAGHERVLTLDGQTHTLAEWCRLRGLKRHTVTVRLTRHWTVREALTIPAGGVRAVAELVPPAEPDIAGPVESYTLRRRVDALVERVARLEAALAGEGIRFRHGRPLNRVRHA